MPRVREFELIFFKVIEDLKDYLAGETYFTVNNYSDNFFFYVPSQEYKRKYLRHIEWDELKILKIR